VGKLDAFFAIFDTPLAEKLKFKDALETGLAKNDGYFYKADTLEALAEQTGFNKATFDSTITTYNGYCDAKNDEAYHKNASSLNKIATPPFYAVKHALVSLDMTGGLFTSQDSQLLKYEGGNTEGTPIPGIYAVGATTARNIIGSASGAYFATGAYTSRKAVEHIIELLK
jgi:fumarate reductase flavoprotein subunit